jgi:protein SCO1
MRSLTPVPHTSRRSAMLGALAAVAAGLVQRPAAAQHEHHQHHATPDTAKAPPPQRATFNPGDTALVDQDGRKLPFKSQVLGDRIAVLSFAYTSCTTVCPVVSALMAQVQGKLGARQGRDVALVTVTVDPLRDTPARLKAYGAGVGAAAGWTWLTGPKPQVDEVLKVFGAYTADYTQHPALVLVGDAKAGKWLRFYGFPTSEQLLGAVNELSAARTKTPAAG